MKQRRREALDLDLVEHAKGLVRQLIGFIGDDPDSEHCEKTPARVIKSYQELFAGYRMTAADALGTTFGANGYDQMVICRDIELYSTCSHHMIPFFGRAHIGYVPGARVVGLSKLARVVDVFARRLQVQERLTDQVADAIESVLKPKGTIVVVEAKHLCMCARGVGKQHSTMVTSSIRGVMRKPEVRAEFLSLIGRGQ